MKTKLLTALLLVLLLAAGCGSEEGSNGGSPGGPETAQRTVSAGEADLPERISTGQIPQPELPTRPVVIEGSEGEVRVQAEIAEGTTETSRGLMAREELGENEGMLFVFDSEQQLNFIMENTLLPLSIAYIDSEGRIVNILDMEPLSESTYPSEEPARYALEVNQGFFEENGVEAGDEVNIPENLP